MNEPIFEIKEVSKKKNYAKLTISPLERGYGSTLGTSLRRVLLTSLSGAAVTSVKIAGVKHQYSTLKGMKEDVLEFLLNLKKVHFKYEGEKVVKATLSVDKAGEVRAKDIMVPGTVEVANPEMVLVTLAKGTKLDAKITIKVGTGYMPVRELKSGSVGSISLDASFSPVKRVNYVVEETRVGGLTNYDKLVIEIWTNGSVSPKKALVSAAEILASYLKQIISPKKKIKKKEKEETGLGLAGNLSVEELGLPTRVANALVKAKYETVSDLVKANYKDLAKVRNLGEKSTKIIFAALGEKGIKLKE